MKKPTIISFWLKYAGRNDIILLVAGLLFLTFGAGCDWPSQEFLAMFQSSILQNDLEMNKLTFYAIMNVAFVIGTYLFCAIGISCFTLFCDRQIKAYQLNFLRVLLEKNILYFDKTSPGSLTQLFHSIDPAFSQKLAVLVYATLLVLISQVATFYNSWIMGCTANILTLSFVIIYYFYRYTVKKLDVRYRSLSIQLENMVTDVLSGISTVINCNGQTFEIERFNALTTKKAHTRQWLKYMFLFNLAVADMILNTMYYVAYYVAINIYFETDKKVSFRKYYIYGKFVLNSLVLFSQVITYIPVLKDSFEKVKSILRLINEHDTFEESKGSVKLTTVNGNILFDHVCFQYPSRPDTLVLKGVKLEIKAGQKVAFVGSSGSGKSTAAAMLVKLLHPTQGRIYLDDARLDTLNTHHLRTIVGYVPQEPVLFTNTVKENLCMGFEVTEQKLREACRTAYALEFIERLPQGFNTVIGAGGVRLSGGQKQRLAIARALVRDPRILVLDEATSALDTESETVVQSALDAASQGRTTITIAHRLSTIRNADNIFVFEQGIVIENGTHDELVAANGSYAELVRAQRYGDNEIEQRMKEIQNINEAPKIESMFYPTKKVYTNFPVMSVIKRKEPFLLLLAGIIIFTCLSIAVYPYFELYPIFAHIALESEKSNGMYLLSLWLAVGVLVNISILLVFFTCGFIIVKYGITIATNFRKTVFKNVVNQDGYFFENEQNTQGNLLRIISTEPENLDNLFDTTLALFFVYFACIPGPIIICFQSHVNFTLLIYGILIFENIIFGVLFFKFMLKNRKLHKVVAKASTIVSETILNISTVQLGNAENNFVNSFVNILNDANSIVVWRTILNGMTCAFGIVFSSASVVLVCLIGLFFIKTNNFDPKVLIIISDTMRFRFVYQFVILLPEIEVARRAFMQLYRLKTANNVTADNSSNAIYKTELTNIEGNVELDNVNFAYPNRPEHLVLRDLTLSLPRGKTVALVGASGCGKSTIVQLLSRMYDPVNGQLKLDGIPYTTWNTQRLRSAFAFVGQTPALFDLPIWQNIAYGHPSATWEEIQDAARAANIHDFIRGLPSGYETCLGSRGTQLSGGQRQRLAIARALVRNPSVIVLDEATSALDARSEAAFQTTLATATKGKTCLIIAHRLSTVRDADVIIVLQNGQVTEQGTHHQLINKGGIYSRLVAGQ